MGCVHPNCHPFMGKILLGTSLATSCERRSLRKNNISCDLICRKVNSRSKMGNYTEEQLSEFQDSFSLFDKKGDGMISCSQIGDVLRALGVNPLLSEVRKLQKEIDPIGEKRLSFDDFLPIYHEQKDKQPIGNAESFIEAFRIFDLDNNGLISAGEVRHLLTMLGEKLSNEEVDALLHGIEDANGKIHYEDFVNEIVKS